MRTIKTVDVHVGGQPVRVVIEGVPGAAGNGAREKALWFAGHADPVRRARAHALGQSSGAPCVSSVSVRTGPAFVHTPSATVARGSRRVPVDIVFAGGFFAIVDSEGAGVPLDRTHVEDLRRAARELFETLDTRF